MEDQNITKNLKVHFFFFCSTCSTHYWIYCVSVCVSVKKDTKNNRRSMSVRQALKRSREEAERKAKAVETIHTAQASTTSVSSQPPVKKSRTADSVASSSLSATAPPPPTPSPPPPPTPPLISPPSSPTSLLLAVSPCHTQQHRKKQPLLQPRVPTTKRSNRPLLTVVHAVNQPLPS